MDFQRWQVGDYTLTAVIENETPGIPPGLFFVGVKEEDVARHAAWLVPDFADARGRVTLRVQAIVVEGRGRRVLVDPCVGNAKARTLPFWNQQHWPFLERLAAAGLAPERIDLVVHTHLHADHCGWDTRLEGGEWRPTFRNARHLYNQAELDWIRSDRKTPDNDAVYADSIAPIFAAGLADVVPQELDLGDGLRLEPSPGHTPGHVSLWIESQGETALVSGDFLHHPVQCAELGWAEIGDIDPDQARATRRRILGRAAETRALFLGTHFATRPAGRIEPRGDAFRFIPL
ncbi:MAG TPA: MBL fold metallo-hydrolase [Myxococcota bacterium]|nr:MBL fold metallo-hydrolase [Myxococcota bacterium]